MPQTIISSPTACILQSRCQYSSDSPKFVKDACFQSSHLALRDNFRNRDTEQSIDASAICTANTIYREDCKGDELIVESTH